MRSAPRGDETSRSSRCNAARFSSAQAADRLRQLGKRIWSDERGAVTAEFAIALPVVLVVLGLVIGGVALSAHRIALVSVAADAVRLEARGEAATESLKQLGAGVQITRRTEAGLHCIDLASRPVGGLLSVITVRAHACAAVSDVAALDS